MFINALLALAGIISLPSDIPWIDTYEAPVAVAKKAPPLRVWYSDTDQRPAWQPPARYRTLDTINTKIRFVQDTDSFEGCNAYGSYGTLACTTRKDKVMIMPNPCQYEEDYAQLLCHELGHVRGWQHDDTGKTTK
jgi:hypothetical protein